MTEKKRKHTICVVLASRVTERARGSCLPVSSPICQLISSNLWTFIQGHTKAVLKSPPPPSSTLRRAGARMLVVYSPRCLRYSRSLASVALCVNQAPMAIGPSKIAPPPWHYFGPVTHHHTRIAANILPVIQEINPFQPTESFLIIAIVKEHESTIGKSVLVNIKVIGNLHKLKRGWGGGGSKKKSLWFEASAWVLGKLSWNNIMPSFSSSFPATCFLIAV